MATTTADNIQIIGGVDTHQDLHTAAVVSHDGTVLGTESFSTTRAGYRAMLRWFRSHGELLRVGVESTGTYGAGITRHLALSGIPVLEVTGPDPASRRAKGKDDALDAISAAEAARTRRRVQVAKDRSGTVEALRVLRTTRKTAIKCRRAALQQLHNTIVAAPEEVRGREGVERCCDGGLEPVDGSCGGSWQQRLEYCEDPLDRIEGPASRPGGTSAPLRSARSPATLWAGRLSTITTSPGFNVGARRVSA